MIVAPREAIDDALKNPGRFVAFVAGKPLLPKTELAAKPRDQQISGSSAERSECPGEAPSPALLYDAIYERRGADVAVYRALAVSSSGSVLELGAGTGRLLDPLLSRGIDAWGLELDPEMLDAGRRRLMRREAEPHRVRMVKGDMRGFALARKFSLIVVACNTLSLLLENQEVLDTLSCAREHLEEGGALAFDISVVEGHSWYRAPFEWQGKTEAVWIGEVAALTTETGQFDPTTRMCTVHREFVLVDGRRAQTTTITHQRSVAHVMELLNTAGFRVAGTSVDERGGPLSDSSCVAYIRATRS